MARHDDDGEDYVDNDVENDYNYDDDEKEWQVSGLCYGAFIFGRDLVQIEWWLKPTHWPDVKSELQRFSSPR